MLTAAQFDALTVPVTDLFAEYETSVIVDIARRLGNLNFASAAWQAQRLSESGALYKDILKKLATLTGKSEIEIERTLSRAGVRAMAFDDKIYRAAGLNPIPLNLSPAMLATLKAGIEKTGGVMRNLTMTTAITAQQSFISASDLAYMQVSTGAMSYNQAITQAVKNIAAQGLTTIDFASGHHDKLDVAMRRTVLTGVAQTANQLQINRADELNSDLVEVSAHVGARNTGTGPANHESWQGKIYSRSGKSKKYPHFETVTGYGTGEGLGGWNCRHSFYPFFEGISEPTYTKQERNEINNETVKYQGRDIDMYEATQIQREIERKIRYWKRQHAALEAAKQEAIIEAAKVAEWQRRIREFIAQTKLDRQYVREQVLF